MLYPQGGNGGKWARAILMVVVAIVAIYTQQYYLLQGYSAGAAAAAGLAVSIVGSLAINALIPPPNPKALGGGDPFQQLASLTGTSN